MIRLKANGLSPGAAVALFVGVFVLNLAILLGAVAAVLLLVKAIFF